MARTNTDITFTLRLDDSTQSLFALVRTDERNQLRTLVQNLPLFFDEQERPHVALDDVLLLLAEENPTP